MRLALDLFELLYDNGEVIRFPIMQSVVCRFADAVKRPLGPDFLLFSWQRSRQGGWSGAEPTVARFLLLSAYCQDGGIVCSSVPQS